SNFISESPSSHWGGMAKLNAPFCTFTSEIGRALPIAYTKRPTKVCVPECLISSQEGSSFPSLDTTISQRPSKGLISWAYIIVEKADSTKTAAKNKLDKIFIRSNLFKATRLNGFKM